MSDEAEATAGAQPTRVELNSRSAHLIVEGGACSLHEALTAWQTMARLQAELDAKYGNRTEGGSTSGFQFEQASENLHDHLPGGWAR